MSNRRLCGTPNFLGTQFDFFGHGACKSCPGPNILRTNSWTGAATVGHLYEVGTEAFGEELTRCRGREAYKEVFHHARACDPCLSGRHSTTPPSRATE